MLWFCIIVGRWIIELIFLAVEWEMSVVVISADRGPRPLGFACSDIEEAELMPDQTANMRIQRIEAVGRLAVAVKSHAFSHADCCTDQDRVGTRYLAATKGDLMGCKKR